MELCVVWRCVFLDRVVTVGKALRTQEDLGRKVSWGSLRVHSVGTQWQDFGREVSLGSWRKVIGAGVATLRTLVIHLRDHSKRGANRGIINSQG